LGRAVPRAPATLPHRMGGEETGAGAAIANAAAGRGPPELPCRAAGRGARIASDDWRTMTESEDVKDALRTFYAAESRECDREAWIEAGGSARVPESASSHYFIDRKVDEAARMARLPPDARVL